jgi:hypothetical protein
MISRRNMLKGLFALTATGLLIPQPAEAIRKYWMLDKTHLRPQLPKGWHFIVQKPEHLGYPATKIIGYHGRTYRHEWVYDLTSWRQGIQASDIYNHVCETTHNLNTIHAYDKDWAFQQSMVPHTWYGHEGIPRGDGWAQVCTGAYTWDNYASQGGLEAKIASTF